MNLINIREKPAMMVNNIDNVLDSYFNNDWSFKNTLTNEWKPVTDVIENQDSYHLNVDIPGVKETDLNLKIDDGNIEISGEKVKNKNKGLKTVHTKERLFGPFKRVFKLPELIIEDKVTATFKNGVLNVVLPKEEKSIPKSIDIKIN